MSLCFLLSDAILRVVLCWVNGLSRYFSFVFVWLCILLFSYEFFDIFLGVFICLFIARIFFSFFFFFNSFWSKVLVALFLNSI